MIDLPLAAVAAACATLPAIAGGEFPNTIDNGAQFTTEFRASGVIG
jgi:hypothetical protein